MSRLLAALGLLLAFLWTPALAAGPQFPALTGRVVDDAHVLSPQVQADLTAKLADLEQKTSRQLVVVTLPSLGGDEIEDYSNRLLRAWAIGQKGINNGALFVVVPSEHKVRIEVGYGMEGVLTDALSSVILQRAVIPKFRDGDIEGGVVDGTDAIIDQMSLDPTTAEQRVAQAEQAGAQRPRGHFSVTGLIIPFIFLIFLFRSIFGRRGGGGLGWLLPMAILGSSRRGWGDGDGWGGGGGGGWGGGDGGGFSGGGGSGGGGGASGSW